MLEPGVMNRPRVAIVVEAGDWPEKKALAAIARRAVKAAEDAVNAGKPSLLSRRSEQPRTELSVVFTDDSRIRRLNARYRGKDRATNVLSFPQKAGALLGDVILASETVRGEAVLADKPLEDHMAHLIIHGFLHLLGYHHEEDAEAEKMEQLERLALGRLGIADPYAAAVSP